MSGATTGAATGTLAITGAGLDTAVFAADFLAGATGSATTGGGGGGGGGGATETKVITSRGTGKTSVAKIVATTNATSTATCAEADIAVVVQR